MADQFVRVRAASGKATIFEAKWDKRAEELRFDALKNVRSAAEKWTGAIASVLAIFGIVTLVKGPSDIQKVVGTFGGLGLDAWAGIFIGLAVIAAVAATIKAADAAYGTPLKIRFVGSVVRKESEKAAEEGSEGLSDSILFAVFAVLLLGVATAITWYGTPDQPATASKLLVVGPAGIVACGAQQGGVGDPLRVLEEGRDDPTVIAADESLLLTSVASCPNE